MVIEVWVVSIGEKSEGHSVYCICETFSSAKDRAIVKMDSMFGNFYETSDVPVRKSWSNGCDEVVVSKCTVLP